MFLFRSSSAEEKKEEVISHPDEDYMIESVYLVLKDGEPVCFRKKLNDGYLKINELLDKIKFDLTLEGKQLFEDWDKSEKVCRIFSRNTNWITNYDKLETVLSLKKVTNN
jgi:Na+-transporting NADH:ubiquinone oxidoreductase subunit NqrF